MSITHWSNHDGLANVRLWYDPDIMGYTANPPEHVRPTMIESYLAKKELDDATRIQERGLMQPLARRSWWHFWPGGYLLR